MIAGLSSATLLAILPPASNVLAKRKSCIACSSVQGLPDPKEMQAVAAPWEPYRSLGTYLMWRVPTVKDTTSKTSASQPGRTAMPAI